MSEDFCLFCRIKYVQFNDFIFPDIFDYIEEEALSQSCDNSQ